MCAYVPDGQTALGSAFDQTQWTVILSARTEDDARRREVLEHLIGRYWPPVYCFLRRQGYDRENSRDLSQGFFHEIVLGRDLVGKADRDKGRFRNFLLCALERYAITVLRRETTNRRRPAVGLVPLDDYQTRRADAIAAQEATPAQAFLRAWAVGLIHEVVQTVERACRADGKEPHWRVFQARVIAPALEGAAPASLDDLCRQFSIASPAAAANMMVTVKRRFIVALRARVRPLVASEAQIAEEIRDLMDALSPVEGRF